MKKRQKLLETVQIDPDAQRALEWLFELRWKRNSRKNLSEAVQQTVVNYKQWFKKLAQVSRETSNGAVSRLTNHFLNVLQCPSDFAIWWWCGINLRVNRRRDFRGNLSVYIWTPTHSMWIETVADIIEERGGELSVYYDLLERIDKWN